MDAPLQDGSSWTLSGYVQEIGGVTHMLYDLRPNRLADCLSVLTSENFTRHNFHACSFADCLSVLTSENFTRHNKYMHIMGTRTFRSKLHMCTYTVLCVCVGGVSIFLTRKHFPDR